uniref:Secreted RxLR effector protein 63 n=1 Tax=Plasmopara viticola TaxID=143451 RepID=RLR63_PLAVT|nr:RecName: Full=Secreted RxLR effector protein 63; Flags: Precursor [Plasmopara viticola]ANC73384.1 secreted RxLR effector peptide protein 63 [Plasmopara viticola]
MQRFPYSLLLLLLSATNRSRRHHITRPGRSIHWCLVRPTRPNRMLRAIRTCGARYWRNWPLNWPRKAGLTRRSSARIGLSDALRPCPTLFGCFKRRYARQAMSCYCRTEWRVNWLKKKRRGSSRWRRESSVWRCWK